MTDILAHIDRVEAHELRPQDIVCVHLAEGNPVLDKVTQVHSMVVEALRERGLENTVFIFAAGIRLEVLRPEGAEPVPIREPAL